MINRMFESEPAAPAQALQSASSSPAEKSAAAAEAIERWIGDHPVICIGAAALTGVVIGCLLKRR